MATGTIRDLLNSGMTPEEINALLSQSNVSTSGFDPLGTTGRGDPYMPPPDPQGRPGMVEQAPLNTIRNNRTGAVTPLTDMYGQPSQSQPSGPITDPTRGYVDTPFGKGMYMKADPLKVVLQNGQILDLGRDTTAERALTKENLTMDKARADIAHTQAQTEASKQKPTEPDALRTIKGAMEIYKSLPEGDMKRAFGEKYGLETKGVDEKTLPAGAVATIGAAGTSVENMSRSRNTFKNDYAGKTILGDLSNTIGRVFGDETGQAQWWQDFDVAQAQARHALFGSALTNTEKAAWEKISINPRMDPEEIRKNLGRRQAIEERAASKLARAYAAGGYNQAQIKELLGTSAGVLDTSAPPVTEPSGPVRVVSINDAMKLPSGAKFIDPNGVTRVRP